jgi:hypothetical protein
MNRTFETLGRGLANFLSEPRHQHGASAPTPSGLLRSTLRPGDVLLVEGGSRISTAVKFLTQSTWSHVALFIGPQPPGRFPDTNHCHVEADLVEGVRSIGLEHFETFHTRICRPVGLNLDETSALVDWTIAQIGRKYDLRNVVDLMRYLLPTPPVPSQLRRRMIALGSGDPTRAICSTLVAEAFQTIGYPILPEIEYRPAPSKDCPLCQEEVLRIRHHSLYAPRDFDVSPYFEVVKPTAHGFDFHRLAWTRPPVGAPASSKKQRTI